MTLDTSHMTFAVPEDCAHHGVMTLTKQLPGLHTPGLSLHRGLEVEDGAGEVTHGQHPLALLQGAAVLLHRVILAKLVFLERVVTV